MKNLATLGFVEASSAADCVSKEVQQKNVYLIYLE
jgi:hypothetical protein